jgi:ABC-type microcin C transport system permease subunit YejB
MQSFTSLLCLLQSIFVQDESEDNINEYMQNYSPINDYLWLITLCVTIIIIVLPLFMYIFYLLYFNKNNFLSEKKNLRNDKTF